MIRILRSTPARLALRVTLIYVVLGALWIAFSDRVLGTVVADPARLTELQTFKGWFFVGMSGLLIFLLVRSTLRSLARSRADLRRTESFLEQVTEHTNVAIWAYAMEANQILYLSRTAEEIWGFPIEEMYATPTFLLDRIHPEDRPRIVEAMVDGGHMAAEYRITRGDGEVRWLRSISSPVQGDGGPDRVVGITEDVTEAKRTERELTLLEEQFRQAQKMEAIGRLAGGVAHDFNNVLTAIQGHARFALDDLGPSSPARDDIGEVLEAAETAQNLTRQLLAFSRQQVTPPKVIDVGEVVQGAKRMLSPLVGADVELDVQLSDPGRVKADPTELEQVLVNLVVNARDAMPDGGRVTIRVGQEEVDDGDRPGLIGSIDPGRYVVLRVADTGTGMDAETRERIFDPFFTTKPTGRGTGLGLSTVFGIVKHSGGQIGVESEPGSGTTFEVYLPATDEAPERQAPPSELTDVRGSETVLVVEDHAAVRTVARRALEQAGYSVHEAENGAAAVEIWDRESEAVDLVLSDLVMPGMGGLELAERLRRLRPELPILFMTGYAEDDVSSREGLQSGMHVLEKPFEARGLQQRVREVLDREKRGG